MNYDDAFEKVIGHEKGYVNNPQDPGGETKYGISKRAYPNENIKDLTLNRAKEIYRQDYWNRCDCDQLPLWIRFHVFDAAVNSGVKRASKWLQISVGASVDGDIGAQTIALARASDPGRTIAKFNGLRLHFIADLPTWATFGRGLVRRIASNLMDV